MRTYYTILPVVLAAFLGACTKTEAPSFETPVAVSMPLAGNVAGPRFSASEDGQLALSWMEPGEHGTTLRYATLVDGEFSEAVDVVTEPRMFVNWADMPSVMPLDENHLVAHWLRHNADKPYSYDVVVAQSFDGGATWGESMTTHTDGTPTEHGFVSIAQVQDGASFMWLDGRNTPDKSMTLRSAVITPDGRRTREQEVDDTVCDCCQTDTAIAAGGPVAVYRDRTADEIRDIYVTRFANGNWQPGTRLYADNWTIAGCPVNGPSIVANGDEVAVVWFSAANDRPVVRVIRSADSGSSFGEPTEIASGRIAGYASLAMLDDDSVAVSWVGRNDDGSYSVFVRHVGAAGDAGPVLKVGESRQLRLVPQLAYAGGNLYIAWTDLVEGGKELKVVRVTASRRNQIS